MDELKLERMKPEDILSEHHLSVLTSAAARLYATAFHNMRCRKRSLIVWTNDRAMRQCHIAPQAITSAQEELIRERLMDVIHRDGCIMYQFLDESSNAAA